MDHSKRSGVNRGGKRSVRRTAASVSGDASGPAGGVVRPAAPADLDALLALEVGFPGDRLSRRALRRHLHSPRAVCLVAALDGGLAGYVLLLRRRDSEWWRVYSLIRAPEAPPGTGRRLLEAAIAAARQGRARGLRLEVRADNAPARRLYDGLGFTLFATVAAYYEDGATALRMALPLGD